VKIARTKGADLTVRGCRLDASFHASDGVKAERWIRSQYRINVSTTKSTRSLREFSIEKYDNRHSDQLGEVAQLFNGPRFARTYVADPNRGMPFLSSSDMLMADLGGVKRLSKQNTPGRLLDDIRLTKGWTLISCSGTVGNTVYVRRDMDGMTGSQHIMRAVPDETRIHPGYLYAYLSSKLGYALLTQGIFGTIIQHIEPENIRNLPVPRLDNGAEQQIHDLIERAAELRTQADENKHFAIQQISRAIKQDLSSYELPKITSIASSKLNSRFEAAYHSVQSAAEFALGKSHIELVAIHEVIQRMFYLGKLHRVFVGPKLGASLLSISDVQKAKLTSGKYISRTQSRNYEEALLEPGWVLISRSGTPGIAVYTRREMKGMVGSEHLIRLIADQTRVLPGYLYAILASPIGQQLLRGSAHGSVQLMLPPEYIGHIKIPLIDLDSQKPIHELIELHAEQLSLASELEDEAQILLSEAMGVSEEWRK